jgi:hypothetical protein
MTPRPQRMAFTRGAPSARSKSSQTPPLVAPLAAFEFDDGYGDRYQLFTRSTYAAYQFVGALLRNGTDIDNLLPPAGSGSKGLVDVEVVLFWPNRIR